MAKKATDNLMEQVAGITECPICSEKFINNRLLPCGHTFCLRCLEQYKKQTNPKGRSLPCPICRKEFGIPKGGCSSLTKNYAVEQLVGAQKPVKDNDSVQCDVCDLDRKMAAIMFCLQCEQNLCADCERTHKKMKVTSMHHILPVSKKDQLRHSVDKSSCCKDHVDHRLELVCSDCNEPICWKCKSLTHHSHNCVEINEMANQCVEQLKLDFDEAENRILVLGKISANIKDKTRQQQDSLEKEKSNIAKISADMIRTVVANEEKLVKHLEAASTRNVKALQPQEERIDKQLEILKQHKASIKQILDCGQPWKIFNSTNGLHEKTDELLKFDKIDVEEFPLSNLSDLQIREHLIGNKPVVQAENDAQGQICQTPNTLLEAKKKRPPPTPLTKPTTLSAVTTIGNRSSLQPEPSAKECDISGQKRAESYPGGQRCEMRTTGLRMYNRATIYSNYEQIPDCRDKEKKQMQVKPTQSPSLAQTNSCSSVKTEANAELDEPVDDSVYENVRRVEDEYANYSPQTQQQTCVEQTLPKKKPAGTSLPGALERKTASNWSNISTVWKITGDCKAIVIGVTVLKQEVYVIHENSPQIQVYHSNTLNWLSEFKLEDLHEPKHLTSCAVNNCLYLAGLRDQTVYKAQSKGSTVLIKFKTDGDSHSISTTKGGNIILIGLLTQTLKEYTTHGTLLKTIILKPDVSMDINPWHAVKLDSGNYLICHGKSRVSKHRVCMISPDGDILKSFGDERGSEMNGLFGPYHLALDEKGNILVADCNNKRLVILNPDLQYVTEIKTDLRYPAKLCFDSATGVLYVADNDLQDGKRRDGQIVLFKPTN